MARTKAESELLDLEHQFWEAIQKNDAKLASRLTDNDCIIVGAQGVAKVSPADFAAMMEHPPYSIDRYVVDESTVQITRIGRDRAVVAYKVQEDLTVDGEPTTLQAYDSSVWVRKNGKWLCALHTESIAGDPYGRDRQSAA